MELKPGYKQTELGVLPNDWDVQQLGQLTEKVGSGITPTGGSRVYKDSGRPFMRSQNVGWGHLDLDDVAFIDDETHSTFEETEIRLGDVFLNITGASIGRSAMVDQRVVGGNVNQHVCIIRADQNKLVPGFLCAFLVSSHGQRQIDSFQAGGNRQGLNFGQVRSICIATPRTTKEQIAIATALSDVDALLEGLGRLIAKKRDLKQAAMQQLLTGDTRLPGFTGEWNPLNMGRQSYLKARIGWQGLTTAEYLESGDYGLVTGTDFREGRIDWGGCHFVEKSRYDQDRFIQLKVGDVLVTKDGTIGKAAYIDHLPFPTTLNSGVFVMRPLNDSYVPKYFFYILMSRIFTDFLNKLAAGSTISHLYQKDFVGFEFSAPPTNKEQSAIVEVLSDMDSEIEALEQRRAKTADLKQAMMQELLTGKTRLFEPQALDEQAEAALSNAKGHNWAINEAVVIATLVKHFGGKDYPLGRKRYTKLSYLLHRHVELKADGYLKKAAGPYNPQTKYGGPEKIAKQNGYITQHKGPKGHSGFIAADNIAQAEGYFEKWYGPEVIQWLEQFRYKKNDDLEVLATVDMAALELRASGKSVTVAAVKDMIIGHPEWEAKLDRAAFSDANIAEAIKQSDALLGVEIAGDSHA